MIGLVQSAAETSVLATEISVSFGSNVTSGNQIIVLVQCLGMSPAIPNSPTDTLDTVYDSPVASVGLGDFVPAVVYVSIATLASSGPDTITVTGISPPAPADIFVFEVSGMANIELLDAVTSGGTNSSASVSTGDLTGFIDGIPTFLVALAVNGSTDSTAWTSGAGYPIRQTTSNAAPETTVAATAVSNTTSQPLRNIFGGNTSGDNLSAMIAGFLDPPVVRCNNPPPGVVGIPYSHAFPADGGVQPYTFSTSGLVPPGLAIDTSSGVMSGTPTDALGSPFDFTVHVTDSLGFPSQVDCSITITAGATIFGTFVAISQPGKIGGGS